MIKDIINYLRKTKSKLSNYRCFYLEAKNFFIVSMKHSASIDTDKNQQKMQYSLLRENHVIEKGMSMKNPRKGFGQQKVLNLLFRLNNYCFLYNDKAFLSYPLNTIARYIEYSKKIEVDVSNIEDEFKRLVVTIGSYEFNLNAGVKLFSKEEIWSKSKIGFESFVKSRHSIRYYSSDIPQIDQIDKALEIAQQTPSACNRQPWKVYIFSGEVNKRLIEWQDGANGFEKDVPLSLLVTSNLNAFFRYEPYQAYVDGGLYSMSLIYSLHSLGFGTIPLSTGFEHDKIIKMRELFGIPENEVPVVIIGVGCLLDSFKAAVSKRKDYRTVTKIMK